MKYKTHARTHKITIAMNSWVARNIYEVFDIAKAKAFNGIELDTNYIPLPISFSDLSRVKKFVSQSGIRLRFHGHNIDVEISHKSKFLRQTSLDFLKIYVDLINKIGGNYLVVHVGYPHEECKIEYAIKNLRNLVEYGEERGVTVSLENSCKGFTSNPFHFLEILNKSHAQATFDIGHSNTSDWVKYEKGTPVEFLRLVKKYVTNAHIYLMETEEQVHLPPRNIDEIRLVLDELLDTSCDWWTIELANIRELIKTKRVLDAYLSESRTHF